MSKFCTAFAIAFSGAATLHGCKSSPQDDHTKMCTKYEKAYNAVDKTVSKKNTKDQITEKCLQVAKDEEKAREEFRNTHSKEAREGKQVIPENETKEEKEKRETKERELEEKAKAAEKALRTAADECFAAGQKNSPNSLNAWDGFAEPPGAIMNYVNT